MSSTDHRPTRGTAAGVGPLLRTWRRQRRMSQQDLASFAEVSTRHLSYVETGKSRPSRELVLHLARHLDVPLREQNDLLLAAGHAPAHTRLDLDDPAMRTIRRTIETMLTAAEPNPTLVMDRSWNLLLANESALELTAGVADHLLEPPLNVLRLALHPDGFAPRIVDFESTAADLLHRAHRQLAVNGDPELASLLAELEPHVPAGAHVHDASAGPALAFAIERNGEIERYLSVVSMFGTALDVTASELTIETFYRID